MFVIFSLQTSGTDGTSSSFASPRIVLILELGAIYHLWCEERNRYVHSIDEERKNFTEYFHWWSSTCENVKMIIIRKLKWHQFRITICEKWLPLTAGSINSNSSRIQSINVTFLVSISLKSDTEVWWLLKNSMSNYIRLLRCPIIIII